MGLSLAQVAMVALTKKNTHNPSSRQRSFVVVVVVVTIHYVLGISPSVPSYVLRQSNRMLVMFTRNQSLVWIGQTSQREALGFVLCR